MKLNSHGSSFTFPIQRIVCRGFPWLQTCSMLPGAGEEAVWWPPSQPLFPVLQWSPAGAAPKAALTALERPHRNKLPHAALQRHQAANCWEKGLLDVSQMENNGRLCPRQPCRAAPCTSAWGLVILEPSYIPALPQRSSESHSASTARGAEPKGLNAPNPTHFT